MGERHTVLVNGQNTFLYQMLGGNPMQTNNVTGFGIC